jgi:hypothetical protein
LQVVADPSASEKLGNPLALSPATIFSYSSSRLASALYIKK